MKAFEFHVHHDGGGLLNPADLPKRDVVAESRHQIVLLRQLAQVSARQARQNEKDQSGKHRNSGGLGDGDAQQSAVKRPEMRAGSDVAKSGAGADRRRAADFQADEAANRDQHKHGKRGEKAGLHRQHGGRQNLHEGQHGKVEQVTIALDRKQLYDQSEQHEVNRGRDECRVKPAAGQRRMPRHRAVQGMKSSAEESANPIASPTRCREAQGRSKPEQC